ncbi:MAG: FAD-dependent oxidoreductase [Planctomycetes bacterium]|nr:FAD-dependent oxidoreductase [Planctomycetota bacterium]
MRIAVVGSGVSGLVVAWLLHARHDVTLFEAADRIGGHVHTHDVEVRGQRLAIDSGFIVFNDRNYPGFTRLLERLGVATQASSMSFSVQEEASGLEWNGSDLNRLFAQRRNLLRPSFWRMVREIVRFNREARALLAAPAGDEPTLAEWLARRRFARELIDHYVVPMAASLWSTPAAQIGDFPARPFARFFDHHGMLQVEGRPQWRVIAGGSQRYVEKLVAPFRERVRLGCPVESVRRRVDGVELASRAGRERFDHVVLALHADQALRVLADATPAEHEVLSALPYQENVAQLHHDARVLPRTRRAWASWNYFVPRTPCEKVTITYGMNELQSLPTREPCLVTLNRADAIDPALVRCTMTYHHPVYTHGGFAAQARWSEISGVAGTHYCGAYWGFGFHEDGVQSALRVARAFGVELA